ncbi:MAG TPA: S8 family serine peptidase [Solirubrobacterales bacterium]|nr:S8 family serine peptidase [Solirubrobacterales bacterium]
MKRARTSPVWAGRIWTALLALVFAAVLPATAEGSSARGHSDLSARLDELAVPAVLSMSPAGQAAALDLPRSGPGSLLRDGNRILVEVHFDRGAVAGVEDLRAAGARIAGVSRRYQTVTVAAMPADLRALATIPKVTEASEVLTPVVAATECQGLATSEGDLQLNAARARGAFGVDGSGVGVGILSDSFDRAGAAHTHAAGDVASGDLPGAGNPCGHSTPVDVLDDSAKASEAHDEGRAMAQIVHDLAPGAALSFATAFRGEASFASNIERLATPAASGGGGASVIADDVFYLEEPFFQDGPVAAAIDSVTASGVAYFSAAGNDNVIDGGSDVASYQAPFRDAGTCPPGVVAETHCMDFDPEEPGIDNTYNLEVEPGGQVQLDLQWAEPWFGVKTNLDAYLLDGSGNVLAESKNANKTKPFEFLSWENKGSATEVVSLAIARHGGTESPTLKFVQVGNGLEDVVPTQEQLETSGAPDEIGPTIIGHSGSTSAVSVGAVHYDDDSEPEPYSSRGPVAHHFGPVSGQSAAAALIPSQKIAKPDLVATDCGKTTFFQPTKVFGVFRFCGTSAATPHAAAVAALMKQSNPSLSYAQLRSALAETASPVGVFGPDAVGAGLIDAYGAVDSVALPPKISITERPPALSKIRRPSIGFSANRPVTFSCSLDGGGLQPCSSPFVPPAPLADGVHGFVVRGVDISGRVGSSEIVEFKIDSKRPRTFFRKHPHKIIRTHRRRAKAVFRFGSNERGVTFVCKVDAGFQRFCKPRLVGRFRVGKHVVSVKARDAAGNVDHSPAVFRFTVKRAR